MQLSPRIRLGRFSNDTMDLCRSIVELKTPEQAETFLRDLCSMQEITMLTERWSIAKLIHMGFSYRVITKKTGASSATIARVARSLSYGTGQLLDLCKSRENVLAQQFHSQQLGSNATGLKPSILVQERHNQQLLANGK